MQIKRQSRLKTTLFRIPRLPTQTTPALGFGSHGCVNTAHLLPILPNRALHSAARRCARAQEEVAGSQTDESMDAESEESIGAVNVQKAVSFQVIVRVRGVLRIGRLASMDVVFILLS